MGRHSDHDYYRNNDRDKGGEMTIINILFFLCGVATTIAVLYPLALYIKIKDEQVWFYEDYSYTWTTQNITTWSQTGTNFPEET